MPPTEEPDRKRPGPTIRKPNPTLTASELPALAQRLPDWTVKSVDGIDRLERAFVFAKYRQAVTFANRLIDLADASDHHPTMLNEVDCITVTWWTFSTRSITHLDVTMAEKTDRLYESMLANE